MSRNEFALAVVTLGLYLLNGLITLVRPGPYLPPAWVYLLTGPPIVAYIGYRLLRARTFRLWENVTLGVLALTVVAVVLPWAPSSAGHPPISVPPEYYLATGAPVIGFLAVRLVTWATRQRRLASKGSDG